MFKLVNGSRIKVMELCYYYCHLIKGRNMAIEANSGVNNGDDGDPEDPMREKLLKISLDI